jgi:intracellular sulfur oxidation DsrE/DsrF family protein
MRTMSKRSLFLAGGAALLAAVLPVAARAQAQPVKNRALFQVTDNDPARWNMILNNMINLKEGVGSEGVEIELVAYGPGIGMLKADSIVGNRVGEALAAGVKVVACENTMKGRKLARKDMQDGISYVPAGVVELVQKQQQGYAYLRP